MNKSNEINKIQLKKNSESEIENKFFADDLVQKEVFQVVQNKDNTVRSCKDILRDIQEVKENALSEGDYKTALKAIELEGKQLALFSQLAENKESNIDVHEENGEEMSTKIKDFLNSLEDEEKA